MGDPRAKAAIKVALDLAIIGLIVCTYLLYTFKFMEDYYISPFTIDYKFTYNHMDAYVHCSFIDFEDHFCGNATATAVEMCKDRADFYAAGVTYVVISALTIVLVTYTILHVFSYACACTCWGVFTFSIVQYIYPPLYILAVLLYVLVSGVFEVTPDSGYGSSYGEGTGPGLVIMFCTCILSLVSLVYYMYAKRTGLTSFLDIIAAPPGEVDVPPLLAAKGRS
jgi:hypothetical protein